jgi:hypothetical protein
VANSPQEKDALSLIKQDILTQKANVADLERQLEIRRAAQESEANALRETLERSIKEKNTLKADLLRGQNSLFQQKLHYENSKMSLELERQHVEEMKHEIQEKWKQSSLLKHSAGLKS